MMCKLIVLGNGDAALVDDEDFSSLAKYFWHKNSYGYAVRAPSKIEKRLRKGEIYMHRQILKASGKLKVDHKNMNPLDNRKENLRFCTHSQNLANGKWRNTKGRTSKYKGVCWSRDKSMWRVAIVKDMKQRHLGYYRDEEEAAKAYDTAAVYLFNEFARTNFSNGSAEIS